MPYNDSNNNATIGYGHLMHIGPVTQADINKYPNGLTKVQAKNIFKTDMKTKSINFIYAYVKVQLTQCQFDALADLIYNIGSGNFSISQVLVDINKCNLSTVPSDFFHFIKGGPGLKIRRQSETDIWSNCLYKMHN